MKKHLLKLTVLVLVVLLTTVAMTLAEEDADIAAGHLQSKEILMSSLSANQTLILALAFLGLSLGVCGMFIYRSIKLKKPINQDSQKLYALFMICGLVGALGTAGIINTEIISGLVGGLVGFVAGRRGSQV